MGADACPQAEAGMPPGPGARRRPKVCTRVRCSCSVGRAAVRMCRLRHRSRVSQLRHMPCEARARLHALHLLVGGICLPALLWNTSTCVVFRYYSAARGEGRISPASRTAPRQHRY
ncbi:uncharacterized protein LOC120636348 [Pararge aegeria]|uniref:uncharacterized protein LOC120636348 n=1 Tax=Pararge aegeria TaxID=116150 RepID=UPI0019D3167C|nr:uncharacterized protein LOC120636348 [Pararge aegeria]